MGGRTGGGLGGGWRGADVWDGPLVRSGSAGEGNAGEGGGEPGLGGGGEQVGAERTLEAGGLVVVA